MANITIRPFNHSEEDYQTMVSVWNEVRPKDKTSVESRKYYDTSRNPKYFWRRLLIERNNRVVAFAFYSEAWWSPQPGKFFIDVVVHPAFQRQGIGTTIYDHIFNILRQKDEFNLLTAETRGDQTDGIQFLTKRGFEQVMRYPISQLHVPDFDAQPFVSVIEQVNASDIEIKSAAELMQEDSDWLRKAWDLECFIQKDVPRPDEHESQPFEDFVKLVDNPNFIPEAYLVAEENGRFVATSTLWKSEAHPNKLFTGLTGTRRDYRRRGLATAMKVRNIQLAQKLGIETIEADNEENNPMFKLNLQLGFKPQRAYLDFHKKI